MKVFLILKNNDGTQWALCQAEHLGVHGFLLTDSDTGKPLEPVLSFKERNWGAARRRYEALRQQLWDCGL